MSDDGRMNLWTNNGADMQMHMRLHMKMHLRMHMHLHLHMQLLTV